MSVRCAVIGNPVEHSRSPAIHQAFAAQTGIALNYERLLARDVADFSARVMAFFDGGGRGLNVTLPFKAAALSLCAEASAAAIRAGSVNTLLPAADGLRGDNTDGSGLVADLERLGIALGGRRILVFGAGGAGRGIIAPLLACGPAALTLSNRTPGKIDEIVDKFRDMGPIVAEEAGHLEGGWFDLVINASAAGHAGARPALPPGLFAPGAAAYDLSYGPAAAPFLDWAREQGARCADGLGMLVEQAALSFALWHGVRPDTAPVHQALATRPA